ncbi:HK97 gp10 family phage protein [Shinella sp. BYT-45]|uniref:HK97 gp10 family phage protein n=1 Tax=Shinella sp. BYT-45 TaxID=3377377 RepID=UPI0039801D21
MTKILNLARLDCKLKRLPAVAKAEIKAGMEAAADEIVATMQNLVPIGDTMALHDSIAWTWGKAPRGSLAIATVKSSMASDLTLTIYAGNAEVYYARWVEFGTKDHANAGMFAGSKHPGTRAQPFFYVSWRTNKKPARARVRKAVRTAARKVASSG